MLIAQVNTTWDAPGSSRTSGGVGPPIQWMRWSCQITLCPPEILSQTGAALALAYGGMVP